jgi:putative ABC transport system ATP-binding protein
MENVRKNYHTAAGDVVALKGIDLQIAPGQAMALMGPSGCGKTTLLNLLGGMDRASDGSIVVDGDDITQYSERQLEKYRLLKVGVMFQFFNLIPTLTTTENLELPMLVANVEREERMERVRNLLAMVGLSHKADKRPEELSGGEQQRVAVCLALVNDPAIILADEPTGNLDSANLELISNLLRSLASEYGKTVIVASHDPKVVEHFHRIYYMRDGAFERVAA